MARKLGNDYHLWVDNGSGTYNRVKGQGSFSITRNGATIDISAKEDFPVAPMAPGMRTLTMSLDIIPDLPDTTGYGRLETLATATSPVANNFQVRKAGTAGSGSDVVFQCSMYITDWNTSGGQNEPIKVSASLVAAAVPAVDALA
jgi:hypothetical protein